MATFTVTLDNCLTCDGRRVDVGDQVDLHLDLVKLPGAESPVRVVVLEVRAPEPPESVLGKITLVVEAADEDLPEGFTTLESDDISYVQCVDCCIRTSERVTILEEQIVGTQETGFTTFSPFIPASFHADVGFENDDFTHDGFYQSKPVFRSGGTNPTFRIQDGFWTYTQADGAATFTASIKAEYPWLQPNGTIWVRDAPGLDITTGIAFSNLVRSTTPILPTELLPGSDPSGQDLIFLKDSKDNLWFWSGTVAGGTWRLVNELIPWNVTANPGGPPPGPSGQAREGQVVRATVQGNWNSGSGTIVVYPGDTFWRTEQESGIPGQLIRVGVEGTWRNIGVTTNSFQVITAEKTWLAHQSFSDVYIAGGTIEDTDIGTGVPALGWFSDLWAVGPFRHGNPITPFNSSPPATATTDWHHATTNFKITETLVAPTADRTQTRPDVTGYQSIVSSPTGKPKWNETIGVYAGKAVLTAGSVSVPIAGADIGWVAVVTPETTGTGVVSAFCSGGNLDITSSNGADGRAVNYIVLNNAP